MEYAIPIALFIVAGINYYLFIHWKMKAKKIEERLYVEKQNYRDSVIRRMEYQHRYEALSWRIDKEVEERLEKRIREWSPPQDDVDEDFRKADFMASKRETINAKRSHPPRADGGEPAKLNRITFRTGGYDPTRPK